MVGLMMVGRLETEHGVCRVGAAMRQFIIAVLCLLSSAFCYAEDLPDPTRPPAVLQTAGVMQEKPSSGLQSVLISVNHRAAIIDGEMVELGKKHGDAKLIEVNEGSVVLQGAQGRQVLSLFPGVKISRNDVDLDIPLVKPKKSAIKRKKKPATLKEKQ